MKRREFIGGLTVTLLAESRRAFSQTPANLPRVGVLVSASPPHPFAEAFTRGLRNLGYTDGQNLVLDIRYSEGRSDRAAELAAELVGLKVDVIVAHFTQATKAAIAATRTIPIVMAPAGAPLQMGFVNSLSRPGGNVTGLSAMDAEIGGRRLQLLRELIPNLSCVAVLGTVATTDPYSGPFVEDMRVGAIAAGVRLEPVLVSGPAEFDDAFASMQAEKVQAVVVQPFFDPHRKVLLELAAKHGLGYLSGSRDTTSAGGLVSISANFQDLYERSAVYVDKILKGSKPADLPVSQPTKFVTVINLKTASALGMTISPVLVAQADEVIE
jgi:putative ABC transport system substrate-binding protein